MMMTLMIMLMIITVVMRCRRLKLLKMIPGGCSLTVHRRCACARQCPVPPRHGLPGPGGHRGPPAGTKSRRFFLLFFLFFFSSSADHTGDKV
jgi:hypothetical protein